MSHGTAAVVSAAAVPDGRRRLGPLERGIERRLLALLLLAPLLGLGGVVLAEVVPDGRVGYELVAAVEQELLIATNYTQSAVDIQSDHFTECIVLGVGLGDEPGEHIVRSALRSPTYRSCPGLVERLGELERTGELPEGDGYLRYWHGYTTVTRPAIALFGLGTARQLTFALLAVAVALAVAVVARAHGAVAAGLLVGPSLLTTDIVVGGSSVSQAIGMSTAWFGAWLAFVLTRRTPAWTTAALAGALAGAVNAYFDLMTSIPGAFALTAVGATLGWWAGTDRASRDRPVRTAAAAVGGWLAGLAWMWGMKWVFAAAVLGVDAVVDDVGDQVRFRLSGENEDVDPARWLGFSDNAQAWWDRPLTEWVVLGVVALLAAGVAARRPPAAAVKAWAACVGVIGVPFVAWHVVLNNHSQIHAWLVYRSLPFAFGGLAALTWVALVRRPAVPPTAVAGSDDTPVGGVELSPVERSAGVP